MAKKAPRRPRGPGGPNKAELLFWLIPVAIDLVVKAVEAAPRIWDAAAAMRERWRQRKRHRTLPSAENRKL